MGKLDGRVAIVTGSGQGIGRAEAIELAKEGAKVALVSRTLSNTQEVQKEIEALGGEALAIQCDVKDLDQVSAAVAKTVEHFGTVDIMVNNAQQFIWETPFMEYTDEDMEMIFYSGFRAAFHFMKEVQPIMAAKGKGVIINTGSAAGTMGLAGALAYAANKEAIRAMTRVAAHEWGALGIRCNNINPVADTVSMTDAQREFLPQMAAQGRCTTPDEIGKCVVFLASDDSSALTGFTLFADGGICIDTAR